MDNLLVMRRNAERASPRFASGHSAEILFFTGVRYYRMVEEPTAPCSPAGSTRPRRRKAPAKLKPMLQAVV